MKINLEQNQDSRTVLTESQNETFPYQIEVFGIPILVFKDVFSPKHFNGWEIFTRNFPEFKNKSILEVGCGTGITSIFLATNGAREVLAVDINPQAVQNTLANIELNSLYNMRTRISDIFDHINSLERFDLIYWNMPFMPIEEDYNYQNVLERGLFDPGYELTNRFLTQAKDFLNPNGKVILGTGGQGFGEVEKTDELISLLGYNSKLITLEKSIEVSPVDFILYELSI
jgi:release factor glutamine methyltransferase